MYHKAFEVIQKVRVINAKSEELAHLLKYIKSRIMVELDKERLADQKDFLISDIQALCRDIANDTKEHEV